jgi:pimeloyl-ACP methyl ester carboxylesterase
MARSLTVINYDRRGRGESGDTVPYAVEREIEDIDALIAETGGRASVYGHSSGACLALHAAARGSAIDRLVLHEPPYGPDDEESKQSAREHAESIRAALREGRRADAIRQELSGFGMPPEMAEPASNDPHMQAIAPTMIYDHEVNGDFDGGSVPEDLVRAVTAPTLVIAGGTSPQFFRDAATRIVDLLHNGRYSLLDGYDHAAPGSVVAPVVADFLTTTLQAAR